MLAIRAFGLLLIFLLFCTTLPAQVSFSQPPTYAGSGTHVFVADFNGDGKPDILTSDGTLSFGNGDGTFNLGAVTGLSIDAVGDFNGDGKPDILQQGNGTLLVLLGNGDGTFRPAISTPSGAALASLVVEDLNGDGKADVIGVFGTNIIVYLSKSDGTFAPGVPYSLGTATAPASATVLLSPGDFNGDKHLDIGVSLPSSTNQRAGTEVVFLGNGDGTLQPAKVSPGTLAEFPESAAVGDFNGDGKADLVVSFNPYCANTGCGPLEVYLFLGNGDGTFQSPIRLSINAGVISAALLAAADLNGDGKADLVFISGSSVAQIYISNGDGTFSNANSYLLSLTDPKESQPYTAVALADVNVDGKLDLIAGNKVLLGNGDGTFRGSPFGAIPGNSLGVATVGAFESGSASGVALLSDQGVHIFSYDGKGKLSVAHTYPLQDPATGIVSGDFNGDGKIDLVILGSIASTQTWSYSVLLGNGDGSFQSPVRYPQSSGLNPDSIIAADFNNDGKLDFAAANSNGTQQVFALLLNNGDGTFAAPAYLFGGSHVAYLISGDFNSDGRLDIAAGSIGPSATSILFGNGDGTFLPAVFPPSLDNFSAEFAADFNADGKLDLIGSNLQVALGNGDGTFRLLLAPAPPDGLHPMQVLTVADLNGDHVPDALAIVIGLGAFVTDSGVLLGNGDGTFGSLINAPDGILPFHPIVADMNGDGRPDLVLPFPSGSAGYVTGVSVILNSTPPGFELFSVPLSPATVIAENSATSAVTITRTFGFSGEVALSCPGLPSGVTCQFNPASIPSGSNTSSLTVSTTSSTAPGTYQIRFQANSGSLNQSVALSLTVQAPPDFSISAGSTTSQTISAGQSASFTLTFTASGSFNDTVNLSCAVTPVVTPAPTCIFSSSSVQVGANGTSVMLIVGTAAPMITTSAVRPINFRRISATFTLAAMLMSLPLLPFCKRPRRAILAAFTLAFCVVSSAACGGGSSSHMIPGTPAGTYTTTVTANATSISHNIILQVIVH